MDPGLAAIPDEGPEVGEVPRFVWGCAARVAETAGKEAREDLQNKIQADASRNPGSTP